MSKFKFNVDGREISVNNAVETLDDWKVKKAQKNSYVKQEVIVQAFESKFTSITLLGDDFNKKYEFLTKVCSRNKSLLEWFALQKLAYSELAQLPNYLDDLIEPVEYDYLKTKVQIINEKIVEFANKRKNASIDYNKKLKELDRLENNELTLLKQDSAVIRVLTLTSQSLPLSMAVALENFNDKTDSSDFEEKKKLYVRELLTEFKISLLKLLKEDPATDIDYIINELSLK